MIIEDRDIVRASMYIRSGVATGNTILIYNKVFP